MSDNINDMNVKQLRNEVQLLRDELAIMKRKFEDIIYNLDTDNFSSRFVKEHGDMKTAIEITAEGIKTQVSKEDLKAYSTIEQTAEKIESTVTKEYVDNLISDTYVTNSILSQTADEIYFEVSSRYDDLNGEISSISITAEGISSKVGNMEKGQFGDYTLFEQTNDTFLFDGKYMRISSAIILTDNNGNDALSLFHQQSDSCIYMWGMGDYSYTPIIIGNGNSTQEQGVYLYQRTDDNLIATQGWVLDNAGGGSSVAVFG